MEGFSVSAVLAVFLGLMLLPLVFIPYIAWSFRRGTTGPGHALICAAGLVYLMALWTYTIVPLPRVEDLVCDGTLRAQLLPLHFLSDIAPGRGPAGLLADPAVRQVVLNVALFVPLGMLTRHLFRWHPLTCLASGLVVSLLIELTQLTGIWWIYPCAFRLFDTDDLLANTLGAAIGVGLAPVLRLAPGQHARPADQPQPVRPLRRLTGMAVDLLSVLLVGVGVPLGMRITLYVLGRDYEAHSALIQVAATLTAAVGLLLVLPAATGATLGQHLVYLRPVRPDGGPPGWHQWVVRFLTGAGAYVLLGLPGDLGSVGTDQIGSAWAVLSASVVMFVNTRGISGYASGLVLVDSRDDAPAHGLRQRGTDPRRLSSAVFIVGGVSYLGISVLLTVVALSPAVGIGLAGVTAAGLVLTNVALAGYLVYAGIVAVRHEGRSLGNALSLLAVVGVLGLVLILAVGVLLDWTWLIVPAVAGLAVSAHLGLLLGAFVLYGAGYARLPAQPGMDAIVVLGSRVYGDRVPPLLAARITKGLEILAAEKAQGRRPLLVLSGGQGPDETAPEGEVMATYAVGAGADSDLVRVESASRNTQENLALSRDLLVDEGRGTSLVVTTNDFHAFRAAIIARELGLDAQVVGAPTARYYFPSAVLREFVGVLARSPLLHGVLAGLVAVVGGGLAWLVTR
ncbi:ElyC/SanA/YdcF family protein [Ornithinimicrobium cavernae]|uniref:ElyC/SanA/YdcF family protein n=1 Tax=Ornithinimicrobium cavernae TaxID=2666047 RepID=UPI00137B4728|nr:ElyC/SanA/YdcF family protein [Ornithinimicrobium cavernae]